MSIEKIAEELQDKADSFNKVDQLAMVEAVDIIDKIGQLLLGFLIVITTIIIPIIIMLEILYICMPILRHGSEKLILKLEAEGYKTSILSFALKDARQAVEEANTKMIGEQSALWIYIKHKFVAILISGFVIAFVLRGSSVIDILDSLFRGVIDFIF